MRRTYLSLALFLLAALPADLRAEGAGDTLRLVLPDQAGAGAATRPLGDGPARPTDGATGTAAPQTWGDNCGYIPPGERPGS